MSFNLLFHDDLWTKTSWIFTFCDFQNFKNAAACSWVSEPCFRLVWDVRKASSWLKSISADTIFRIKFSYLDSIASNCSLPRSGKSSWCRKSSVISDSPKYSLRANPFSNPTTFLSAEAIFDLERASLGWAYMTMNQNYLASGTIYYVIFPSVSLVQCFQLWGNLWTVNSFWNLECVLYVQLLVKIHMISMMLPSLVVEWSARVWPVL